MFAMLQERAQLGCQSPAMQCNLFDPPGVAHLGSLL